MSEPDTYAGKIQRIQRSVLKSSTIHLTKKTSNCIIKNECPFCEYYSKCRYLSKGKKGVELKKCIQRSSSTFEVWLDVTETTRPDVSIGDVFGKLTVEEYGGYDKYKNPMWVCRCECGNTTRVRGANLLNENTTSCGCYKGTRTDLTLSGNNYYTIEKEKIKPFRYRRGSSRNTDGTLHKYPGEFSSKVNQQVDIKVTHRNEDDPYDPETNRVEYVPQKCSECGGIVRYDEHGFKTCTICGLMSTIVSLDNDFILLNKIKSSDYKRVSGP